MMSISVVQVPFIQIIESFFLNPRTWDIRRMRQAAAAVLRFIACQTGRRSRVITQELKLTQSYLGLDAHDMSVRPSFSSSELVHRSILYSL